jgi:hypothetical protein
MELPPNEKGVICMLFGPIISWPNIFLVTRTNIQFAIQTHLHGAQETQSLASLYPPIISPFPPYPLFLFPFVYSMVVKLVVFPF